MLRLSIFFFLLNVIVCTITNDATYFIQIDWKKTGTCLHILAQDDKECADSDRALPVYLLKSSEVDSLIENARPGDVFEEIPVVS